MLAKQYIDEGIRIRKTYLSNLEEILKIEPSILEKKKKFDELSSEMESVVKSDKNDIRKTLELNNTLMVLEKEIISIQNMVKPYHDEIEKLRNDTDKLYLAIKEKYPNITPSEIEDEIMSKVGE